MPLGGPAIGDVIAWWGFWALLILGWIIGELDVRRTAVFVGLWVVGRVASGYFFYGWMFTPFTPYVAILDIALVFIIFKGDVRLN